MPVIIKANGETEHLKSTNLEILQKAVGGYIELVPLKNGCIMYVDEEGSLKDKPYNMVASAIAGQRIVGDVVSFDFEETRAEMGKE